MKIVFFSFFLVSLKDRVLSIQAKMDRKTDDGSRYFQEVTREYLLPETLKIDQLKSVYGDDGVKQISFKQHYRNCIL